jgi:hypothetical protein
VALATGLVGFRSALRAAVPDPTTNDPAVIFVWLPGGPPHMETFDMKPNAPSDYRGEFNPIKTNVPGIEICEHLPTLARQADRFALIRSIAHKFADHGGGHKKFLTGRDPLEPAGFVTDYPMVGSMAARLLEDRHAGVPNYVNIVDAGRHHIDVFSFGSAYLGPATHPFAITGDPSDPAFAVRNLSMPATSAANLPDRLDLLGTFDRSFAHGGTSLARGIDASRERAVELATSPVAKTAFDLNREPATLRAKYGDHRYGQRCLLARRLVEAGASWVTVVLENATPRGQEMIPDGTYNWDSHAVNCHIFKDTRHKLGFLDQALAALIEDLSTRGLDRRVLLVVTGEFGRTPRIEHTQNRPGRDHWPLAQSILVAGGGLKMGQVIGSTTSKGETPKDRPMVPNHLWATVFEHLKLNWRETSFLDNSGRPMPMLPDGEPIAELF